MSDKKVSFEGLTLTLKKRKLCVKGEGQNCGLSSNEYLVLGHFDQMSISHIDSWLKWAPYHMDPVSLQDEYVDKYSIKAYYPDLNSRQRYERIGLNYSVWDNDDKQYPFVVASVINVSDEFARKASAVSNNSCDILVDLIHESIHTITSSKISNMHIAIFPTIGYSDFLLLFESNDLKTILRIIEQLKMKGNSVSPYVSNAYTFIGFCNHGLSSLSDEISKDIELTIRFSLQEGISVSAFQKELDKTLGSYIQKTYKVLGNSDLMIVSNSNLRYLLPLYFYTKEPGAFHPSHNNFNFIRSMQSEICIITTQDDDIPMASYTNASVNDSVSAYKTDFIKNLEQLDAFMHKYRMPGRIVYGLEIVMKRYLQLIQSHHCFDMQQILGNAFQHLEKCVSQNITVISSLDSISSTNTWYYDLMPMLKALNLFREKVGDYLADMQRSDSLFLEGRSLSHPSVGSATKLLFFYNIYINQIKGIIDPTEKDRYSFVVMSGGTDQTQAIDLFSHLDPSDPQTPSIILITIPESSLYDVKSSLFHMLHELLHFCGKRNRKERLNYTVDALCNYTAILFSKFLKEDQLRFINFNLEQCYAYLTSETKNSLHRDVTFEVNKYTNNLRQQISHEFKQCIQEKLNDNTEKLCFYGKFIYAQLEQLIEEILTEPTKDFEHFLNNIYAAYRLDLLQALTKIFSKYGIPYSGIHLIIEQLKAHNKILQTNANHPECHETKLISCIINLYLGKEVANFNETIQLDSVDTQTNLKSILYVLKDLFKECYADCMAGKIMNIQQEEFIFSFLTEARNEMDAFPTDVTNRLRMVINFRYLFSVQENNLSLNFTSMNHQIEKLKEKGTCYVKGTQIEQWLKQLLDTSEQQTVISSIITPVINYIDSCQSFWKNDVLIQKQLHDLEPLHTCSEMKDMNDTYKFLSQVMNSWLNYAKFQE